MRDRLIIRKVRHKLFCLSLASEMSKSVFEKLESGESIADGTFNNWADETFYQDWKRITKIGDVDTPTCLVGRLVRKFPYISAQNVLDSFCGEHVYSGIIASWKYNHYQFIMEEGNDGDGM